MPIQDINFNADLYSHDIFEAGLEKHDSHWSYSDHFSKLKEKISDTNSEQGYVAAILGAVCDYMLAPENANQPFGPMFVVDGRRSLLPEDFSNSQISELEKLLPKIRNKMLLARVADTIWVTTRNHAIAVTAAEAYLTAAENGLLAENKIIFFQHLERSLRLSHQINSRSDQCLSIVKRLHYYATDQVLVWDNYYDVIRLADLALEFPLDDHQELADNLDRLIPPSPNGEGWKDASEIYSKIADVWKKKDKTKYEAALLKSAESLELFCAFLKDSGGNAMLQTSWLSSVIEIYRKIPNTKNKRQELHNQLLVIQERQRDEFAKIDVELGQISYDEIEAIKRSVKGKTLHEALHYLTSSQRLESETALETAILKSAESSPLQAHMPINVCDDRGRHVRTVPPLFDQANGIDPIRMEFEKIRWAGLHHSATASMRLAFILEQISADNSFTISGLRELLKNRPFIPDERLDIYARGFYYGFTEQWIECVNILAPQIEHSLRHLLNINGITTTHQNAQMIQVDMSISMLFSQRENEIRKLIGNTTFFHLKALFESELGESIRHKNSHGNFNASDYVHNPLILSWFVLTLRLILGIQYAEHVHRPLK